MVLRSDAIEGVEAPPFTLTLDQKANHATLLGLMKPGERQMSLPCVLHLPGMGSLRITCAAPRASLDYDARRRVKPPFVRIAFPPAVAVGEAVEYQLEVVAIHPDLPGIAILRLLRAFRVFRLFKRLESLRKIIMAIEAAIPGVINAFSILLLVIALYAILGVEFFSITNREYFGDFGRSMFTLFQVSPTRTAKTTRRCDPIRHR